MFCSTGERQDGGRPSARWPRAHLEGGSPSSQHLCGGEGSLAPLVELAAAWEEGTTGHPGGDQNFLVTAIILFLGTMAHPGRWAIVLAGGSGRGTPCVGRGRRVH